MLPTNLRPMCSEHLEFYFMCNESSLSDLLVIIFFYSWNASQICVSSLRRGRAHLLCIVSILVYVLPKRAQPFLFQSHITAVFLCLPVCVVKQVFIQSMPHYDHFEDVLTINLKSCGTDNAHNSREGTAKHLRPHFCTQRQWRWQCVFAAPDFRGIKRREKMCVLEQVTCTNTFFKVLLKGPWGLFPFLGPGFFQEQRSPTEVR